MEPEWESESPSYLLVRHDTTQGSLDLSDCHMLGGWCLPLHHWSLLSVKVAFAFPPLKPEGSRGEETSVLGRHCARGGGRLWKIRAAGSGADTCRAWGRSSLAGQGGCGGAPGAPHPSVLHLCAFASGSGGGSPLRVVKWGALRKGLVGRQGRE